MGFRTVVRRSALVGVTAMGMTVAPAAAQAPTLSVQRIWGSSEFSSDLQSLRWVDPEHYVVVEGAAEIYRVEAGSGERELLLGEVDLVPPGESDPIRIEDYQFSSDRSKLLIFTRSIRVWRRNTKGFYFVWDFADRTLTAVSPHPGYQMFAKFSPDGRYVGFVRDHNIYVRDLRSGDERQLTHDGDEDVINGTSDWVYEEELGLRDAFRFSLDGRRVAFWRFDQTGIEPFYLLDELALYPDLKPVRYPKAGRANSEVRLGVVEIETGETTWIDLGTEPDIYVADMDFADSPTEIWFTRLNRHQNRLDLMLADVRTGASRVIMTDRDAAWVDAREPMWLDRGERFLFLSERDGFRQLFLFDREGALLRKVTTDAWDVLQVYGVDERRDVVYFAGAAEGPLHRPLYRIGLDGTGFRRITEPRGTHGASFNQDFSLFIHTASTATEPARQMLRDAGGQPVRSVADNAELREKVAGLDLVAPEFMTVPAADGTPLSAYLIKPRDFDASQRYPLLMYVYGGPGSQTVRDSWGGSRYLWHQMLAEAGYLVASVDNRGTGGRGRDFMKQTYQRLGQLESDDQIVAARYFASLPYVDQSRIGIWGWSYGGYMSLLSLFRGEDAFKAAISVAPVTDWRLYDTIYTERYMRTPQENSDGYDRGAPLTYADRLDGNLLVIHGTGDDNVHAQNTVQLVQRLEEAGKQFDMRLYPNKTHAIAGRTTRVNLYDYMTRWLLENL